MFKTQKNKTQSVEDEKLLMSLQTGIRSIGSCWIILRLALPNYVQSFSRERRSIRHKTLLLGVYRIMEGVLQ